MQINWKRNKVIIIFATFLLLSIHNSGCIHDSSSCGNNIIRTIDSPTKQLKAIVFERNCGATTGFSTQISIMPADRELPNNGGNTFIADTDHGKALTGPGGGPPVEVQWLGENSLHIAYDSRSQVYLRNSLHNEVTITYSEKVFQDSK